MFISVHNKNLMDIRHCKFFVVPLGAFVRINSAVSLCVYTSLPLDSVTHTARFKDLKYALLPLLLLTEDIIHGEENAIIALADKYAMEFDRKS